MAVPGAKVLCLPPPYDSPAGLLRRAPERLPRGSVVLVEVGDPETFTLGDLARPVQELRLRAACPVVLVLPQASTVRALQLAGGARTCGISGVMLREHPTAESLRVLLSEPPDLAADWLSWVQARHAVPGETRDVLLRVIRTAPRVEDVPELCDRLGVSPRTVSHRLRQAALPRLERWLDGSRLLHAELELQRDPGLTVDAVAARLGYVDDLSYSSRIYRLFGATPAASRKLLGVEWRLEEWWHRSRQ